MDFFLGTHQPAWLARFHTPLMVSRRALARYRVLPRARCPWFRDSGGFTELQLYGHWTIDAPAFVAEARRDAREIGGMVYCAPRDWMCEPIIINGGTAAGRVFVGTHLSVTEHQRRTVADYLDLYSRAPELPWVPVLQGWTLDDYLRCMELYDQSGIDLATLPRVGVGSICRRQGTKEAAHILSRLTSEGLHLHAFGLKGTGIPHVAPFLASSDSLAWSYAARRRPPLPECAAHKEQTGKGHKNCANCARYALRWLAAIRIQIKQYQQHAYQPTLL